MELPEDPLLEDSLGQNSGPSIPNTAIAPSNAQAVPAPSDHGKKRNASSRIAKELTKAGGITGRWAKKPPRGPRKDYNLLTLLQQQFDPEDEPPFSTGEMDLESNLDLSQ